MVNPNFISLTLHPALPSGWEGARNPPDTVLERLAKYMTKNNIELRKMHNDGEHFTIYASNHRVSVKIILQPDKAGGWSFRVASIRQKRC